MLRTKVKDIDVDALLGELIASRQGTGLPGVNEEPQPACRPGFTRMVRAEWFDALDAHGFVLAAYRHVFGRALDLESPRDALAFERYAGLLTSGYLTRFEVLAELVSSAEAKLRGASMPNFKWHYLFARAKQTPVVRFFARAAHAVVFASVNAATARRAAEGQLLLEKRLAEAREEPRQLLGALGREIRKSTDELRAELDALSREQGGQALFARLDAALSRLEAVEKGLSGVSSHTGGQTGGGK